MMLCHSIDSDSLYNYFENKSWLIETKFDGLRASYCSLKNYLINRLGVNITYKYPELFPLKRILVSDFILDGEIVVFKDNKSDFHSLSFRSHSQSSNRIRLLSSLYPVTFIAFDILKYEGIDLRNKPLIERKKILNEFKQFENGYFKIIDYSFDKKQFIERARQENQEGIILKNINSKYKDERSFEWLKFKFFKEMTIRFTKYETNPDNSITLESDSNIRVKCNDLRAVIVLEKQNYVKGVISYLETEGYRKPRFPVLKKLV